MTAHIMKSSTIHYLLTSTQFSNVNYFLTQKKRFFHVLHFILDPLCFLALFMNLVGYWHGHVFSNQQIINLILSISWLAFSSKIIRCIFVIKFYLLFRKKSVVCRITLNHEGLSVRLPKHPESLTLWKNIKVNYQGADAYLLLNQKNTFILLPICHLSEQQQSMLSELSTNASTENGLDCYFLK